MPLGKGMVSELPLLLTYSASGQRCGFWAATLLLGKGMVSELPLAYVQCLWAKAWFPEAIPRLQVFKHVSVGDGWVRGPPKTEHFPAGDAVGPLSERRRDRKLMYGHIEIVHRCSFVNLRGVVLPL